ncbi:MAG: radical SAM protein [Deltaproteobacteria bacterium]|nr:radical SAM protein [Deltaproteobacteria bacterium]
MNATLPIHRHPCFNKEVKGHCGRVHLPVAPRCNIQCNYCNRKYDCVNESRPGVTSAVLSPRQALMYMEEVLRREPRITVAGIAGPGDPFADPRKTLETLRLVRARFPEMILCLASNGLAVSAHLDELAAIGVSHVTLTVNAVDPEVGRRIYAWVRDGRVIYRGAEGAELLLSRQLGAIKGLKERGIIVKVNTIVIPGVNDHHVEAVAVKMSGLGVDILNCMSIYPNEHTAFADVVEPTHEEMERIRARAEAHLPQLRHCTRCRADAVGLLDSDRAEEFRSFLGAATFFHPSVEQRPYVAVATLEGMLVNQHLGEAERFQIWRREEGGFNLVEERSAPLPGGGTKRWAELATLLRDCRAVLVSGIGETPAKVLMESGILPVEMSGFITMGLEAVYEGGDLHAVRGRREGAGEGRCCSSDGTGCL